MEDRIRDVERRYEELSSLLADPATIADPKRLREYSREHSQLSETVQAAERYHRLTRELAETRELLSDPVFHNKKAISYRSSATSQTDS